MSDYTVGLINQTDCLKVYAYTSFEEAEKEFKSYKKAFLNNNLVNNNTTIIERDEANEIVSIKTIFNCDKKEKYIMFLAKNVYTSEV